MALVVPLEVRLRDDLESSSVIPAHELPATKKDGNILLVARKSGFLGTLAHGGIQSDGGLSSRGEVNDVVTVVEQVVPYPGEGHNFSQAVSFH